MEVLMIRSKEGAEALSQAIIVSACDEYRRAAKHWHKATTDDAKNRAKASINSVIRFFNSKYCYTISPLDPMIIMEKLNKELKEEFGIIM